MKTGRPKELLALSEEQRMQLESIAGSRSLPHGLVQRARLVLLAADNASNTDIAERLHISKPTVGKWRARYLQFGIQGLHDDLRPGRPRTISDKKVALVVRKTLTTKPNRVLKNSFSSALVGKYESNSRVGVNEVTKNGTISTPC